jgi:mycothiol synthase
MPTGSAPGSADSGEHAIEVAAALTSGQAAAALEVVARAAAADGLRPVSEHVMLHLRYGGEPSSRDLLVWRDGALAGYGHLDLPDGGADGDAGADGGSASGEMTIDPRFRRRGLGLALARELTAQAGDRELRVWAHGDLPAAGRLAAAAGFERARELRQLRRPLDSGELAEPRVAEGVTIRTFRVGQDEDAWTALNRKAFASHPEQGTWTRADLEVREREPWFDPAGFFLAERDGRLAGFHWTKVHSAPSAAQDESGHGDGGERRKEPIGEVYVVGVDPAEQGTGLGRALTLIGLHHLRDAGLTTVMLYVDADNPAAIRLYESLGFARWHTDVMYTRPAG